MKAVAFNGSPWTGATRRRSSTGRSPRSRPPVGCGSGKSDTGACPRGVFPEGRTHPDTKKAIPGDGRE